mgnify:CR=1 FL=1
MRGAQHSARRQAPLCSKATPPPPMRPPAQRNTTLKETHPVAGRLVVVGSIPAPRVGVEQGGGAACFDIENLRPEAGSRVNGHLAECCCKGKKWRRKRVGRCARRMAGPGRRPRCGPQGSPAVPPDPTRPFGEAHPPLPSHLDGSVVAG